MENKTGVLLINLGTPQAPTPRAVGEYLKEFLMDPYVIDIPFIFRWILVHFLIVPRRSRASALLYEKIWTSRGSPLLFHTEDLTAKLQKKLGPSFHIEFGMRYGSHFIASALREFKKRGIKQVNVVPLYPQYSLAATESISKKLEDLSKNEFKEMKFKILRPFYNDSKFIDSFVSVIQPEIENHRPEKVLFSFHGIPERHIRKVVRSKICLTSPDCCDSIRDDNRDCYRAQCFETAKLLASRLSLQRDKYEVSFQSRLGRTPWIKPYTDLLYQDLVKRGVKKLLVVCPAFVADCLETLEEIAIRGKKAYLDAGGEALHLAPSLNAEDIWVEKLAKMIKSQGS